MVVFPAASRPNITTRISRLPNNRSNSLAKVCPMLALLPAAAPAPPAAPAQLPPQPGSVRPADASSGGCLRGASGRLAPRSGAHGRCCCCCWPRTKDRGLSAAAGAAAAAVQRRRGSPETMIEGARWCCAGGGGGGGARDAVLLELYILALLQLTCGTQTGGDASVAAACLSSSRSGLASWRRGLGSWQHRGRQRTSRTSDHTGF